MSFIATLLFFIGWRRYIHVKPFDTVVTNCIPVIVNAFQLWYQNKKKKRSINKTQTSSSLSNSENTSRRLAGIQESMDTDKQSLTFLDFARTVNHGKYQDRIVDDVNSLRNALILFIVLFPYNLFYHQVK